MTAQVQVQASPDTIVALIGGILGGAIVAGLAIVAVRAHSGWQATHHRGVR